jgi:hypothetical protein
MNRPYTLPKNANPKELDVRHETARRALLKEAGDLVIFAARTLDLDLNVYARKTMRLHIAELQRALDRFEFLESAVNDKSKVS